MCGIDEVAVRVRRARRRRASTSSAKDVRHIGPGQPRAEPARAVPRLTLGTRLPEPTQPSAGVRQAAMPSFTATTGISRIGRARTRHRRPDSRGRGAGTRRLGLVVVSGRPAVAPSPSAGSAPERGASRAEAVRAEAAQNGTISPWRRLGAWPCRRACRPGRWPAPRANRHRPASRAWAGPRPGRAARDRSAWPGPR